MRAKTLLLIIILACYGYYVRSMTIQVMGRVDAMGRQYAGAIQDLDGVRSSDTHVGLVEYAAAK